MESPGTSAPVVLFLVIRTLCSHFSMGTKSICALESNTEEPSPKASVHLHILASSGKGLSLCLFSPAANTGQRKYTQLASLPDESEQQNHSLTLSQDERLGNSGHLWEADFGPSRIIQAGGEKPESYEDLLCPSTGAYFPHPLPPPASSSPKLFFLCPNNTSVDAVTPQGTRVPLCLQAYRSCIPKYFLPD